MKKYWTMLIAGVVVGALFALLFLYMEFGGVTEHFSPYAPPG